MSNTPYRFTKPSSRDYGSASSSIPKGKDPRFDLQVYLDSHQHARSLRLADMVFGDEGAPVLQQFLAKNSKIESIELRGNGLSSEGFAQICEGLVGNNTLKTFSAEWNNIGSGIRGLEALAEFLAQNNSLEHLDLRNNKITSSAAQSIANIIRASHALVNLDLRWNELGGHGAKAILSAIEANDKLLYCELKGNNVPEDIIAEINLKLDQNRTRGGGTEKKYKEPTFEPGSHFKPSSTGEKFRPRGEDKEALIDLQNALSANNDLERALLVESRKNADLKEKFYRDLDLTTRELQNKIDQLVRENDQQRSHIKNLENDNAKMKKEHTIIMDRLANLEKDHLQDLRTIEEYERDLKHYEQEFKAHDSNFKSNLERLTNDNHLKMVELENAWDLKVKELVRENDYLTTRNRDLESEVKRLAEENRQLLFSMEDKIRDASFKAREEERQKNLSTIRSQETALRAAEEEIYRLQRELEEKELGAQRKINFLEDRMHQADEEIKRLKHENNMNVDFYNKEKLRGEALQNDIMARDNAILKLESEVRELKKVLHNNEVLHKEETDILHREHQDDKNRWEDTRITLQNRISDLERQNRQALSDLNKLRSDMQRLSELLVSNLSQTVYRTISDLNK